MKKTLIAIAIILLTGSISANPWLIVLIENGGFFHLLDLGTYPPIDIGLRNIYPGLPLRSAVICPTSTFALIGGFNGIYRVDLTQPDAPVSSGYFETTNSFGGLTGEVHDIAMSPDNRYAVAISAGHPQLLFIDLADADLKRNSGYLLKTPGAQAYSVAIAEDGRTVIVGDYDDDRIIFGAVNDSRTGLVFERTLATGAKPVNIAVSPVDGTVLVANFWERFVSVYNVKSPGMLQPGPTRKAEVSPYPQSIAFSPDGRKAYVYSVAGQTGKSDMLSWLAVQGPGVVTTGKAGAARLSTRSVNGRYGSNILDVSQDARHAFTSSCEQWSAIKYRRVSHVDLRDFSVTATSLPVSWATLGGVAVFSGPPFPVFPPASISVQVIENDCIFFKERINRLLWESNPLNCSYPARVRIYRKETARENADYLLITEINAGQNQFDDRGLRKDMAYSYRLTSVLQNGQESEPAELNF